MDITLPMPVLLSMFLYVAVVTAYIVKIGVTLSAQGKNLERVETDFKAHVTSRAGTIDRIWTAIETGNNRVTRLEARGDAIHGPAE